jgi:ParB/RepB/Spo0J family partition protein
MEDAVLALEERTADRKPVARTQVQTGPPPVSNGDTRPAGAATTHRLVTQALDLTLVDPDPDQPRKFPSPFSLEDPGRGVDELAASIRERGLLQPILVQRHLGRYRVLVGERRWRAFRLLAAREPASWTHIPAIEWPGLITPAILLTLRIIENDHREAPDPADRRAAYLQLRDYCEGNASEAIRMLAISRATFYRVLGEHDPETAASVPRPKAASRLSFGQMTRALDAFDDDRLDKLSEAQARELGERAIRIASWYRERFGLTK